MFSTIRRGLFAALAGFTVVLCLCYSGLALVIAYVTEDMLVERLLQREVVAIERHFRQHGELAPPAPDWMRLVRSAGDLPAAVRQEVAAGRLHAEIFAGAGVHYHLRTLDLAGARGPLRVYLVADVAPLLVVSRLIQDVGGVVIFVAVGLTGLALGLAWLLSRRLVLPLQALAHDVRALAPDAAIAPALRGRRDEIGYLARRLDAAFGALHAALAREHAFTRDVGHELRTPLTVMKNTLVQAGARPLGPQQVAQLGDCVDEIGHTVDVLFALAREQHLADQDFDLRACIEECLLRRIGAEARDPDWLDIGLPERLMVSGSRPLAMLLLGNCIENALFHGGPDVRLRIGVDGEQLYLTNTVDPARPVAIQGFRHGQHLLRRIADAMRWRLDLHAGASDYRVVLAPRRPG